MENVRIVLFVDFQLVVKPVNKLRMWKHEKLQN